DLYRRGGFYEFTRGTNWRAIAALGAVFGLFVGMLGAYFGSDLRDGLTREI
ncbi:MAG: hypothetical protein IH933_13835, partial [Euryarchaeota archaeon]|nr:hypothetical protein [Euryarchaeota archaeon]